MLKDAILKQLMLSGQPITGSKLSEKHGVTRSAVWKIMQQLKDEGYSITSHKKSGYYLKKDSDVLSMAILSITLSGKPHIEVVASVSSTDALARAYMGEYGIFAANMQTDGVTLTEEKFLSPSDEGLYFSLRKKIKIAYKNTHNVQQYVYDIVLKQLAQICGLELSLADNLIYFKDKRLAAISCYLTIFGENIIDITVGVGINTYAEQFGRGGDWCSLFEVTGKYFSRNILLAGIANELYAAFK